MPFSEQIILTTSNGDVFAMYNRGILMGICRFYGTHARRGRCRAKMNIGSGEVTDLTHSEIEEVPVGPQRPINRCFSIVVVKYYSLQIKQ